MARIFHNYHAVSATLCRPMELPFQFNTNFEFSPLNPHVETVPLLGYFTLETNRFSLHIIYFQDGKDI